MNRPPSKLSNRAATRPDESPAKQVRSDGAEARQRLLLQAMTLFAEQGYSKTSIRQIAQAARTNVAAVSYYFGDKQGLYRAIFEDPHLNPGVDPAALNLDHMDIRVTVDLLLRGMVEPLKAGEQARLCMKLHFREMVEPTGMWQAEIDHNIKPAHLMLVRALSRHMACSPDDEIHRLAFEVTGMGIMLHVGHDVIQAIRPGLTATPAALDRYHTHLLDYAMTLIDSEARRRKSDARRIKKPVSKT